MQYLENKFVWLLLAILVAGFFPQLPVRTTAAQSYKIIGILAIAFVGLSLIKSGSVPQGFLLVGVSVISIRWPWLATLGFIGAIIVWRKKAMAFLPAALIWPLLQIIFKFLGRPGDTFPIFSDGSEIVLTATIVLIIAVWLFIFFIPNFSKGFAAFVFLAGVGITIYCNYFGHALDTNFDLIVKTNGGSLLALYFITIMMAQQAGIKGVPGQKELPE